MMAKRLIKNIQLTLPQIRNEFYQQLQKCQLNLSGF